MKRTFLGLCIATLLVLLVTALLGCAPTPAPTPTPAPSPSPSPKPAPTTPSPSPTVPAPVTTLRYTVQWPEPSPNFQVTNKPILDEIEKNSNGRIKFQVFAGGTLGAAADQWDIVRTGKADFGAMNALSYQAGRFPLSDAFTFPLAYEGDDKTQAAVNELAMKLLSKETAENKVLSYWQSQTFYIYTAKAVVKTIDDMKGLKLRSAGGVVTPAITALGGTPVMMAPPDLYLSLQTGVVGGAIIGPSAIMSFKLSEVTKYVTKVPFGHTLQTMMVNPDVWAKLSPDLQKIMTDASLKAGIYENKLAGTDDPKVIAAYTAKGGEAYTLPAAELAKWTTTVSPVITDWVSQMKAKGLAVDEVMTAIRDAAKTKGLMFPY